MNELENKVQSVAPGNIDITIIDGMFFLHLFPDLPSTFGFVASHILRQICRQKGNEIHIIFDETISPSIKDCERTKRAVRRSTAYQITGPEQKRPTNCNRGNKLSGQMRKTALCLTPQAMYNQFKRPSAASVSELYYICRKT